MEHGLARCLDRLKNETHHIGAARQPYTSCLRGFRASARLERAADEIHGAGEAEERLMNTTQTKTLDRKQAAGAGRSVRGVAAGSRLSVGFHRGSAGALSFICPGTDWEIPW
jgi:hypothetical protein